MIQACIRSTPTNNSRKLLFLSVNLSSSALDLKQRKSMLTDHKAINFEMTDNSLARLSQPENFPFHDFSKARFNGIENKDLSEKKSLDFTNRTPPPMVLFVDTQIGEFHSRNLLCRRPVHLTVQKIFLVHLRNLLLDKYLIRTQPAQNK